MTHLVRLLHSHLNPKLAETSAQRRLPRHLLLLLRTVKVRDVNALLEGVLLHFSSGLLFTQRGKVARRSKGWGEQLTNAAAHTSVVNPTKRPSKTVLGQTFIEKAGGRRSGLMKALMTTTEQDKSTDHLRNVRLSLQDEPTCH
jgi:hypothetical protein